jgi:uncharacterized protein (TIGR02284 family)
MKRAREMMKDVALKTLLGLVAACNDAAAGYAKAAKSVRHQDLSNWLTRISYERERFAVDLSEAISELEKKPVTDLQEGGILRGGWPELEQGLRSKEEQEILEECILGDTGTLKHYQDALAQDLPASIRSIVEGQKAAVERDLDSLRSRVSRHKSQHA